MGRNLIFLYFHQKNHEYLLSDYPKKELGRMLGWEVICSFSTIKNARLYIERKNWVVGEKLKKSRDFMDQETREVMRQKKLGSLNPNFLGLSEKHKRNIGKSMKGKNLAQFNVNFGKPRDFTIRAKISHTKLKNNAHRKKRWAVSELGVETLVNSNFVLPPGWAWGRKRSVLRRRKY